MDIPDYDDHSSDEEKVNPNKVKGKDEFGANLVGWN